ncbi:GL17003 [Drosophila persimilis]|uniref:GL17003 n=1 Tax=Drosophila persimilis TaxID=7234 RepID=B4GH62_DROPE|nr:GL17003 [Drosophila persimilis]
MCPRLPHSLRSLLVARSQTGGHSLRCFGTAGAGCGCGCQGTGGAKCKCGPNCPWKLLGRLGPSPRNTRDFPPGCTPGVLLTKAFTLPAYMPASLFRILAEDELPGPEACRNQEYFAYHRFSYYDLKMIISLLKQKANTDCK